MNLSHVLFYSRPESNQDSALRQVRQLCKTAGARLTLMTVLKTPSQRWSASQQLPDSATLKKILRERAENDLRALAGDMESHGIRTEICVAFGKPYVEVIQRVNAHLVDLVMLSAQPNAGATGRLLGSTALHLIRKAPCPVWAVKTGNAEPPRNILAAVDLSEDDTEAMRQSLNPTILRTAESIGQMLQMDLHIVQASQLENEGFLQIHGGLDQTKIDAMNRELIRSLQSRLAKICKDHLTTAHFHPHVEKGPAIQVISGLVKRKKIDLLVMGTMSRGGIAGLLIGNTAETLLQEAECSILALKPTGFTSPIIS